jgi:hypothetical protein
LHFATMMIYGSQKKKIELQINAMKKSGCKMSSTDGLAGNGI